MLCQVTVELPLLECYQAMPLEVILEEDTLHTEFGHYEAFHLLNDITESRQQVPTKQHLLFVSWKLFVA